MWIQVRSMDGKTSHRIDGLSKLTPISDLRERIEELFEVSPHRQRLFYRGKQFVDGHTLFDYNVGLNEIVQLLVKPETPPPSPQKEKEDNNNDVAMEEIEPEDSPQETEDDDVSGATYKLGDILDCRDTDSGAWYEGKLTKVVKSKKTELPEGEDGFDYSIIYDGYEEDVPVILPAANIRPRARKTIKVSDLEKGDKVMINYNAEFNNERGFWYDATVKKVTGGRKKTVVCTVYVGKDLIPIDDCKIMFPDEVFAIEEPGTQINENDDDATTPDKRTNKANCDHCRDNPKTKCKECACHICGGKNEPKKTILCDECDMAFHIFCLKPPLEDVPDDDEWFCPLCKNDSSEVVMAGEKLKASKKKAKMASSSAKSTRDWGKGMACAGRSKICTIVPSTHYGPIPGVEVGMSWKYRLGASETGVHRPHVAGIHGQAAIGAFSIVLAGGYEDDKDNGEVFTYTGSGGRDLSGNKRTAEQSSDQLLTKMNLALARNCNAKIDSVNGGKAEDWKKGKPVRVLRSEKGRKHSDYAPEEGIRYDGIYKVSKYWREKGKSGFYVWRYKLKRDDPTPAPWTEAGMERIEQLGYTMQVPDGYWENEERKAKEAEEKKKQKAAEKRKRKRDNSDDEDDENCDPEEEIKSPPAKVKKVAKYIISSDVQDLIDQDKANQKLWDDAISATEDGGPKFLAKVEENFSCICCMDIVCKPVTTDCNHNICKSCITRSFKSDVYTCPACRFDLGKDYKMSVNKVLSEILNKFFPGYETGR